MTIRVELLEEPSGRGISTSGGVTCEQRALVTIDRATLEQLWTRSTLELVARSYWTFLRRRSLGLIRVTYSDRAQVVTLLGRIPLLRFRSARFSISEDSAAVEWPIGDGLLVARNGRDRGYLRITASRSEGGDPDRPAVAVSSTVSNFYPWIRGRGRFARFGTWLYTRTQFRIHVAVTRGFLRSLAELPAGAGL